MAYHRQLVDDTCGIMGYLMTYPGVFEKSIIDKVAMIRHVEGVKPRIIDNFIDDTPFLPL